MSKDNIKILGMGIFLGVLIFALLPIPTSAADWVKVSSDDNIAVNGKIVVDGFNITLIDRTFEYDDDGVVSGAKVIIDIEKQGITQTHILTAGSSLYFGEDGGYDRDVYKVAFLHAWDSKIALAAYKYPCPSVSISSDEKNCSWGTYDRAVDLELGARTANVYDLEISFEFDDEKVVVSKEEISVGTLAKDQDGKEKSFRYKITDSSDPSLVMVLEFEDEEGNEYTQKYDVLEASPVVEVVEVEEKESGVRVIQAHDKDYTMKLQLISRLETVQPKLNLTANEEQLFESLIECLKQDTEERK